MDKFSLLDYLLSKKDATSMLIDFVASMGEDDAFGFLYLLADTLDIKIKQPKGGMVQ